jgi:predicted HTH transcriptional regulator
MNLHALKSTKFRGFMSEGKSRKGRKNQLGALTTEEAKSLVSEITFEDLILPAATLSDLDTVTIYQYLRRRNQSSERLEELLHRLDFLVDDRGEYRPTVAALLLFGKKPQDFGELFNARLRIARFAGTLPDKFLDIAELSGSIPRMLEDGLRFFHRNTRHPLIIDPVLTGTYKSVTVSEYPEATIREGLVNALSHCDYSQKRPVYMKIFDDRIEVENPGGIYLHRKLDEVRGHHIPRNRRIADVLHTLGWSERFGTGLIRMERLMLEADLPAPKFYYNDNTFSITLNGPGPNNNPRVTDATRHMDYFQSQENSRRTTENWIEREEEEANTKSGERAEEPSHLKSPVTTSENLEEFELQHLLERLDETKRRARRIRQARALAYIRANGQINRTNYVEINEVQPITASEELLELEKYGFVQKFGSARATAYRLPI